MLQSTDSFSQERNPPIQADFVPLPSAEGNDLAQLVRRLTPPTALTFSTPFVRAPVVAPPDFTDEESADHQEIAHKRWEVGWTPKEEMRALRALDADRETLGGRYSNLVQDYPWLMLALEGHGLAWDQALFLAEQLTRPPLDWFTLDQATTKGGSLVAEAPWLPLLGDPRHAHERVLTPYRRVAVAVLSDLGTTGPLLHSDWPLDEERRPSRLLQAALVCGVAQPGTENPSRGARRARGLGRSTLAAIGAWPWACFTNGDLGQERWWEQTSVICSLDSWRRAAQGLEACARLGRQGPLAGAESSG